MKKPAAVIGVDPGKAGAIALVSLDLDHAETHDLPFLGERLDLEAMKLLYSSFVERFDIRRCLIEAVMVLPRQGGVSGLTMGRNYGELICCLKMMGLPVEEITPMAWKKRMFGAVRRAKDEAKPTKTQIKAVSVQRARALFPALTPLLKTSKDGRAEALLMAEVCRRNTVENVS